MHVKEQSFSLLHVRIVVSVEKRKKTPLSQYTHIASSSSFINSTHMHKCTNAQSYHQDIEEAALISVPVYIYIFKRGDVWAAVCLQNGGGQQLRSCAAATHTFFAG